MTAAGDGRGVWRHVRAHPLLSGGIAAAAVAGVVVVLVWFQPQALLFDTVVDEDFPGADPDRAATEERTATPDPETSPDDGEPDAARSDADDEDHDGEQAPGPDQDEDPGDDDSEQRETDEPGESAGPITLRDGTFESRNRYTVEGRATVFELEDGTRTLRLEDFSSTNGPDLLVYLTAADHADEDAAMNADFVDLGDLTGNIGNQNYDLPLDVDLEHYDTVVIWCRRFTVSFGAADLAPAG